MPTTDVIARVILFCPKRSLDYALDIVVMAKERQAIEQARPLVTAFLGTRGLALNQDKTRLRHRTEGIDFLGFHIQMRGKKLLHHPPEATGARAPPEG